MKLLLTALLCIVVTPAFAAYPVVAVPPAEQAKLLESDDPQLAANKRIAYEIYRIVMAAQVDLLDEYVAKDLINHNPNEEPGLEGLKKFIRTFLGDEPRPMKDTLDGLVSVFAEGDMVIMSFVRELDHPNIPGEKYTTTWFDMFRIVDGLLVEHWDPANIEPN
jgi:predicted SnoaL-like aldol condensation-catalyzing enzyme